MSKRGENIRKRKDGRWEGRYIKSREANGKAIYGSVYGKTYTSVKEKLKEVNNNQSEFLEGKKMTFGEALFLWLESNKIKQKTQTYSKYLQLINTQIMPSIGQIKLSRINYVIINQYISEKSISGNLNTKEALSPSYIQTICFIIESTIRFCVENNLCSPISGKIVRPAKVRKDIKILSFEEQRILERILLTDINETKVGILLSLYAGLRVGEVCGLRWENIDLENGIIHIDSSVERIKNINKQKGSSKTVLILSDTKSDTSNRTIPISNILQKILLKNKQNNNRFVIEGKTYPYADPRTLQYAFKKCLKQGALPEINYHALRHTFATRCVEAGVDIKSLSEILGHSNVNITLNTYVHSSLEQKKLQIEKLNIYCGQ
ncbi:MAG: site-specific integrase [Clostridia bacterium]|nr:site-specific integrase [Clostridia bacterium]